MRTYIADIGVSSYGVSNGTIVEFNTIDELISQLNDFLNDEDIEESDYDYFSVDIYLKNGEEEDGEPVYGSDSFIVDYRVDSRSRYVYDEIDAIISKVRNEVTEEELNKLT